MHRKRDTFSVKCSEWLTGGSDFNYEDLEGTEREDVDETPTTSSSSTRGRPRETGPDSGSRSQR